MRISCQATPTLSARSRKADIYRRRMANNESIPPKTHKMCDISGFRSGLADKCGAMEGGG